MAFKLLDVFLSGNHELLDESLGMLVSDQTITEHLPVLFHIVETEGNATLFRVIYKFSQVPSLPSLLVLFSVPLSLVRLTHTLTPF